MARLGIITYGHPTLRKVAREVTVFDKKLRKLISDMVETMRDANGIGLAAPQVNHSIRLLVVDTGLIDDESDFEAFINPVIIEASDALETMEEGCLSLPGISEEVTRPERIKVAYQDEKGRHREIVADGLYAVVIQHEIDHLDGTLLTDHLSTIRRKLVSGKLSELESVGLV